MTPTPAEIAATIIKAYAEAEALLKQRDAAGETELNHYARLRMRDLDDIVMDSAILLAHAYLLAERDALAEIAAMGEGE